MDTDWFPQLLLGPRAARLFERRVLVLAPGQSRPYDEGEWRGAIVLVERGRIELECLDGSRHCFRSGDVLWLERLPLRALHGSGRVPAVLIAISRRAKTER